MFGNLTSKLTYNKLKVTASSSFIDQIAKQKQDNKDYLEEKKRTYEAKYEDLLDDAIQSLRKFVDSDCTDEYSFKNATLSLEKAQKLKPSHAETYYYFSWLFLYIREFDLAAKYFNVANVINPEMNGLDNLRDLIESFMKEKTQVTNSYGQKEQSFKPKALQQNQIPHKEEQKNETQEGQVFKPQPLQANMKRAGNSYSQYNRF